MSICYKVMSNYIKNLPENRAVCLLMDCLTSCKAEGHFLISGGEAVGKSHFLRAMYQRLSTENGIAKLPPDVLLFNGEALGNLLLAAKPSGNPMPLQEKKRETILLIDDLHNFPFHSLKAFARLYSLLQRHQVVIATSRLPLEKLPAEFGDWGHIRLHELSEESFEIILCCFLKQMDIRLSITEVAILRKLYQDKDINLEQAKDLLFTAKECHIGREGLLLSHERAFHKLFRDCRLDEKVRTLMYESIKTREELIKISNEKNEKR